MHYDMPVHAAHSAWVAYGRKYPHAIFTDADLMQTQSIYKIGLLQGITLGNTVRLQFKHGMFAVQFNLS